MGIEVSADESPSGVVLMQQAGSKLAGQGDAEVQLIPGCFHSSCRVMAPGGLSPSLPCRSSSARKALDAACLVLRVRMVCGRRLPPELPSQEHSEAEATQEALGCQEEDETLQEVAMAWPGLIEALGS